jgi:hypothetical protein
MFVALVPDFVKKIRGSHRVSCWLMACLFAAVPRSRVVVAAPDWDLGHRASRICPGGLSSLLPA